MQKEFKINEEQNCKQIIKNQKNSYILSNKSKNFLINLVSFLMNNKNDFNEKIKPSELEFIFETNSNLSFINKLVYKIHINYASFNIKRDIVQNIKKYKQIPSEIEMRDEYYIDKIFETIYLNFNPVIRKGIILDLTIFPFYSYIKDKKKADKFQFIKNNNINSKFNLVIYIFENDNETINKINNIIEQLNKTKIWDYFQRIYIIMQIYTFEHIMNLAINEKINKYICKDNSNPNNKIIYLFNDLKSYEKEDNVINIFKNRKSLNNKNNKDYFFILDQLNKIIKIKDLSIINETVSYFIFKLNGDINNYSYYLKEKEKKRQIRLGKMKEMLYFISKLKKLDYIFSFDFDISINIAINDELTEIELKKINYIKMNGKFIKKEYNYLLELFKLIRQKECFFSVTEIITIDIEIEFNNMKCQKCFEIIPENSYLYYCYICKKKYCMKCIQEQLKNKGKAKYIDQKHNLIFFKTREKNLFMGIDKEKLGYNRFAEAIDDNNFDNKHNAECSGCRGNFLGTERYICLCCKKGIRGIGNCFIDYCGKCIEKMCNNKEEMEKLESKPNGTIQNSDIDNINNFTRDHKIIVKHKHENHIYLMLPLQLKQEEEANLYFNY